MLLPMLHRDRRWATSLRIGSAFDGNKTNVFVQSAKVLYAPVVRLHAQCRNDATGPRDPPDATIVLEFHFANDAKHPGRGGKDLSIADTPDAETGLKAMSWTTAYATIVSGLQKTGRYAVSMTEEETKILKMFCRFLEPKKEHRITLHMCDFSPPTKAEKASVDVFGKPLRGKRRTAMTTRRSPKLSTRLTPIGRLSEHSCLEVRVICSALCTSWSIPFSARSEAT